MASKLKTNNIWINLVDYIRPFYRWCRTKQLRLFCPSGGYLYCNGIKVFCNFMDNSYAWYDCNSLHLRNELQLFRRIILNHPGNVCIDIGAHFGYFSRGIAETIAGTNRKLICLEPDKINFCCLKKTMGQLLQKCRIEILPFALNNIDDEIEMYESDTSCKHTYKDNDVAFSVSYKVKGVSLDTLVLGKLESCDRIAFIKVDTDGSEAALFAGGIETLRKHKPILFIEFSPFMIRKSGQNPEKYFSMLNEEFHVYWYTNYRLKKVASSDFCVIEQNVKNGITDLLLSYSEYLS